MVDIDIDTDRIVQAALDDSSLLPASLAKDSYPDFQDLSRQI